MSNSMSNLQNLSIKDILDAFTGPKEEFQEKLPNRDQVLRAFGAQATNGGMTASFGVFAAGMVLGAGLAALFTPRPGAEVREAISEKVGETISSFRPTGTSEV